MKFETWKIVLLFIVCSIVWVMTIPIYKFFKFIISFPLRSKHAGVILACLLMSSCGISKNISESDTGTVNTTIERTTKTRPNDTVRQVVPVKLRYTYKDTVITTYSYKTNTVLTTSYDNKGNQTIDCIPEAIKVLTEKIEQLQQNNIQRDKETKHEFNPQNLIYAIAALAGVMVIGMMFLGFVMIRMQKAIPDMLVSSMKQLIKN